MRRRLGLMLIPLAAGLLLLGRHAPRPCPLELRFGAGSPSLREVDLHFERDHRMVRDVMLRFPEGAPPVVSREVRLAPGDYAIGIRLVYAGGAERHVSRTIHTGPAGGGGDGAEVDLDVGVSP